MHRSRVARVRFGAQCKCAHSTIALNKEAYFEIKHAVAALKVMCKRRAVRCQILCEQGGDNFLHSGAEHAAHFLARHLETNHRRRARRQVDERGQRVGHDHSVTKARLPIH